MATSRVADVLATLKRSGTQATRDGYARYGIDAPQSFGVSIADIKQIAKSLGKDHTLALELWQSGWYEARLLACFVGEPEQLTAAQMDAWCRDFDNWGVVDTACFHLFDRSQHAWKKIDVWCKRKPEFERRAGFVLLACVALHDKTTSDLAFRKYLPSIEKAAHDERNFVKKGVSWALVAVGERSVQLNKETAVLARRLSTSTDATERWVGKDALRKLTAAATLKRLARKP